MKVLRVARNPTGCRFDTDEDGGTFYLTDGQLDALKEWLERQKVRNPRERARSLIESYGSYPDANLETMIAAAIEDAARRGVDWEEG